MYEIAKAGDDIQTTARNILLTIEEMLWLNLKAATYEHNLFASGPNTADNFDAFQRAQKRIKRLDMRIKQVEEMTKQIGEISHLDLMLDFMSENDITFSLTKEV